MHKDSTVSLIKYWEYFMLNLSRHEVRNSNYGQAKHVSYKTHLKFDHTWR